MTYTPCKACHGTGDIPGKGPHADELQMCGHCVGTGTQMSLLELALAYEAIRGIETEVRCA